MTANLNEALLGELAAYRAQLTDLFRDETFMNVSSSRLANEGEIFNPAEYLQNLDCVLQVLQDSAE